MNKIYYNKDIYEMNGAYREMRVTQKRIQFPTYSVYSNIIGILILFHSQRDVHGGDGECLNRIFIKSIQTGTDPAIQTRN